ncbi:hypothetical protein [Allobranchiibius sp. CTAmp26]|uniref:hypothetical protein n=1 Tax=Allobranchiibius sp. CTAmp26 TaxID=2815214 RepID=UPI001AA14D51|nr:hypothetical protein [Allobranchiibius sp. CTAmp26]MBO1756512.1 hypothetical protein [Allobranchiibius sp. CTAmp26]
MNTILISSSPAPHGSTHRVAAAIAEVLNAPVVSPEVATSEDLAQADRIGFGSEIQWMGSSTGS